MKQCNTCISLSPNPPLPTLQLMEVDDTGHPGPGVDPPRNGASTMWFFDVFNTVMGLFTRPKKDIAGTEEGPGLTSDG